MQHSGDERSAAALASRKRRSRAGSIVLKSLYSLFQYRLDRFLKTSRED